MSGTRAQQLDAALSALGRGEPPEAIARVSGIDERLVRAVTTARPSDARAVWGPLLDTDHLVRDHEARLRSALVWPTVTMGVVLLTSLMVGLVAAPSFELLARGPGLSRGATYVPAVVAMAGLGALLVAARRRWSLGFISSWNSLDAHAFCAAAVALGKAGVALPAAVRGAAEVCEGPARDSALALARELEAGAPGERIARLLGPLSARLLRTTAVTGAGLTTLEATAALRAATLPREVRRDAGRLSFIGLSLAGLAMVATGAAFFIAYLGAL